MRVVELRGTFQDALIVSHNRFGGAIFVPECLSAVPLAITVILDAMFRS